MNSLIDLHSYGHDIEAAWLVDRALIHLDDDCYKRKLAPINEALEDKIYEAAYNHHSLANECEHGVVDEKRVWWVQAEAVVGFYNAWEKRPNETRFKEAAEDIWGFIKEYVIDSRKGGEWFSYTDKNGTPSMETPIVEPWKCPYHKGRMCMEIIRREK